MDGSGGWDTFVNENLLRGGAMTGTCLISHQGVCLHSTGLLNDFQKTPNQKQILDIFGMSLRQNSHQLRLHITGQGLLSFQVHQQTSCSLYATSSGSQLGLLLGNLPHGLLLCTYTHREPEIGLAKKQFEHVCSLLRS